MPEITANPTSRLNPVSSAGLLLNGKAREKQIESSGLASHVRPARPLPAVCLWAMRAIGSMSCPARQRSKRSSLVDLVSATRSRMQLAVISPL